MNKERIFYVPDTLHPATANLVGLFAEALAFKMDAAQKKYGYTNNWMRPDWMNICRAHLLQHLGKGDPRDVAAYCAFLWYHGESTTAPLPQSTVGLAQALQLAHEHMQLYLQHYTENHNVYEAVMAALTAQPAQEQEPVAWVVFASNGNCRIWFGDKASAERWADATGVRSLLQLLYTAPPAAAADVPPDALDLLRIWKTWLGDSREQCDDTGKRLWDRIEAVLAGKPAPAAPEGWQSELLDWVSACQSAYHIDNTPGHRFGGLGSNLEENRAAVVEYVAGLLTAPKAGGVEADNLKAAALKEAEDELCQIGMILTGEGWDTFTIARTLDVVRIALYGGDGNGGGTEAFPAAVKALHELRAEEAAQAAAQKGGEA